MHTGWIAVTAATVYIGILFAIAFYGDRVARRVPQRARPNLYALAISVYCTSWTFFGSVGLAASSGLDFLPIYIGPVLMFTVGFPLLARVVRLSKAERITSVADFLSARYGKSQSVAVVATLIAVIGAVPYIALQLKAVSSSVGALVPNLGGRAAVEAFPVLGDIALLVAIALALFAILFGTRQTDATEHQAGMMLAVATEAVVKLAAFMIVGAYVTFVLFDGPSDLITRAINSPEIAEIYATDQAGGRWLVMTGLAFFAVLLLPRQFHIIVVENNSPNEIRRAAWLFPTYLVAINLFVVPIAVGGKLMFGSSVDADLFVLQLPHASGDTLIALIAFIGGLSAATAMVIVASVALAIMISNEIVVPAVIRRGGRVRQPSDMGRFILNVRRAAIIIVLLLGYAYYRAAGSPALAAIGLLSFAAIAQLAPAFLGGLIWRRATARGAIAGMTAGLAVWAYTLLLPTFVASGMVAPGILEDGPFGIALLRPQALFAISFDPLSHGVFWSLTANVAALTVGSLSRPAALIERLQANLFVPQDRTPSPAPRTLHTGITVKELTETVSRYLGHERTRRSFEGYERKTGTARSGRDQVDLALFKFAEQLLASAIGAASSRLVLTLLVNRENPSTRSLDLLDDASEAIHYNRELLQTVLDRMDEGAAVFDPDLKLICWNKSMRTLLNLPPEFGQFGIPLKEILTRLSGDKILGEGDPEALADQQITQLVGQLRPIMIRDPETGRIVTINPERGEDGGLTLKIKDVTQHINSEEELRKSATLLEKRVQERTLELTRVNNELEKANAAAEEANIGKTRFIAAAGHDILQPLNAARLYSTALADQTRSPERKDMVRDMESALGSVEDIIKAVLEISRLDTGALVPEVRLVEIRELLDQVRVEFEPIAREKGLTLTVVECSLTVRTDPHLLGRLLQNLVSNAIKYTRSGRVLIGCRRRSNQLSIEVLDTGIGINEREFDVIYREFHRLEDGIKLATGLGLGLSIVQRISSVLLCPVAVTSTPQRGTRFTVSVPLAPAVPIASKPPAEIGAGAGYASGMTILCIDNDTRILSGMEALLTGWGCHPISATNAKTALKAIRKAGAEPDMMLVDYHLDEGNGLTAIAEIRWKHKHDLPALLITADRSQDVRAAADEAGVPVLHKPVKPAALKALMAQWSVRMTAAE